ncbi:MAG: helix-turn-helix domain-containing protein [Clostridia bacterium]
MPPLVKLNFLFKEKSGQTVTAYIASARHAYIKKMLIGSELSVKELSLSLGFSQPSSFIRNFKRIEGVTPGEYRSAITEGMAVPKAAMPSSHL